MSRYHKFLVHFGFWGLALSGIAWFVMDRFVVVETSLGFGKSALQPYVLWAHGFFALVMVFVLGQLTDVHVRPNWNGRKKWLTGRLLLITLLLLTIGGHLLYYTGWEELREFLAQTHWYLGLGAVGIFFIHFRSSGLRDGK